MRWRFLCLWLAFAWIVSFSASAVRSATALDDALRNRIEHSPKLPFSERRFEFHAPTQSWAMGAVSGVALRRDGLVYVMQRGAHAEPILAFDKNGDLLRSWGKGDFTLPHSIRLDPEGNIWAIDAGASRLIKYSPTGQLLLTIDVGQVPDTGSSFRGATDVAFTPDNHLLVTDGYGNARVLEYDARGRRVHVWGRAGSGEAEFNLPHAIQISQSGVVYIADRENGRIEEFDLNGKFLANIGGLGRCYSLKLEDGALWASMGPMDQEPGAPGWLVKIDR